MQMVNKTTTAYVSWFYSLLNEDVDLYKTQVGGGGGGGGPGGGGGWGGCEPRIEVILKMQRMQKRRGWGTVGGCEPRIEVIPEYHSC